MLMLRRCQITAENAAVLDHAGHVIDPDVDAVAVGEAGLLFELAAAVDDAHLGREIGAGHVVAPLLTAGGEDEGVAAIGHHVIKRIPADGIGSPGLVEVDGDGLRFTHRSGSVASTQSPLCQVSFPLEMRSRECAP